MTQGRDTGMDAGMNVENRLAEAMRRTAEALEPPVAELVGEGIARGRRRRLRSRVRAASAVTAVAVAAGTAGTVVVLGTPDVPPLAEAPPTPAVRLASAAEVLGTAARTVQARRPARPRPGQWLYTKSLESGVAAEQGPKPRISEDWIKLDGSQDASLLRGKLVTFRHTSLGAKRAKANNDRLASLPADPRRLRSIIYKEVDAMSPRVIPSRDGQAFRTAAQMLWDAPVTMAPATQAALYRVLAAIPGVHIDRDVKDGAGRPAIAMSHQPGQQFLLDPVTYQVVAQRAVSTGRNAAKQAKSAKGRLDPDRDLPVGTVTYSFTRVITKLVDQAGRR